MLFSEPKIPQFLCAVRVRNAASAFQCSSASRKFLNRERNNRRYSVRRAFQCSSASRKFLNGSPTRSLTTAIKVSVLFSEPKIPQSHTGAVAGSATLRFSALQRAENSSIRRGKRVARATALVSVLFSEPKIPQSTTCARSSTRRRVSVLFSEPKIPQSTVGQLDADGRIWFQCSSASRKFLNSKRRDNSSETSDVSVLFSEPKIPQWNTFQSTHLVRFMFQCSSASRKFLNPRHAAKHHAVQPVSVLFSEPKIPQCALMPRERLALCGGFSALQRAENSSIRSN